jgi:ABC-type bacteriocin/lantibiotic exporter with double-glycine peptidase domain
LALKLSGLDKIVQQLPEGLDTIITENGKNISGGQQQRLALARAFYKNSQLIILDEPFNELDAEAMNEIIQVLQSFSQQGKMILLVSHDKDALKFCNKIIRTDAF